jgi:DNA-binding winged helix-turn-helix (wHTH) protein
VNIEGELRLALKRLQVENASLRDILSLVEADLATAFTLTKMQSLMLLLLLFYARVTRDQMAKAIWGGYPRLNASLDTMVRNMRKRLADIDPRITVDTIHRRGWKLSAESKSIIRDRVARCASLIANDIGRRAAPQSHGNGD